ncbi:MAG: Dabb family protein, partial [Sedimenticola sp.]
AAAKRMYSNAMKNPGAGYTRLVEGVSEDIAIEVGRCMQLWGSAGQADAVQAESALWTPVEHLIIYNVAGISEQEAYDMIAEGEKVLSTIPGVLEVVTGESVKEDADYRYTWLVRFCHTAVIDSYRDHPLHVTFADNRFRPVAGGRISIDYKAIA